MRKFFENFNLWKNPKADAVKEAPPQALAQPELSAESLRGKFLAIVEDIKVPEGALTQVSPELLDTIHSSTYYHGTKTKIEEVRKNGFVIPKAKPWESSQPFHVQIGGKNVFFTTDYEYALSYANQNPDQVISIKIPENLNCVGVNYHVLQEAVFPTIMERTKEVLNLAYPEGYTKETLLDCADSVLNLFLIRHGVDVITNDKGSFVHFIGQEKIPKI